GIIRQVRNYQITQLPNYAIAHSPDSRIIRAGYYCIRVHPRKSAVRSFFMRHALLICVLLLASLAAGEDCTAYVVVNVYNPKLSIDVLTLKAEDFEARMDKTVLPIVSSTRDYTS